MPLSFVTACLPFPKPANDSFSGSAATINCCIFCHVTKEEGFKIVWEDDSLVAFHDHKPAAQHHLLIIPKSHIPSVRSLEKSDVALVQAMGKIGHQILDDFGVPASLRRMGFHIPPFNSVDHLHLHVHGLPYTSYRAAAKYPIARPALPLFSKGFSWFVDIEQTVRILEKGGRIGFFPC